MVELRNKPELKISINQDGFQILDSAHPANNGDYSFLQLDYVEFHPEQIDWLVAIMSVVIDLVTLGGINWKFKNKPKLKFKVDNKIFKVYLIDADLEKAKAVTDLLNKKSLNTTTYKNNA